MFNRPQPVYVWLKLTLTPSKREALPPNYADLVKESLTAQTESFLPGQTLLIQELLGDIYRNVTGIGYIRIQSFATQESGKVPENEEYRENENITINARQRALVEEKRIEVELA